MESVGTVFATDYFCDCESFSKIEKNIPPNTRRYRITGYETIEVKNKFSNKSLYSLKQALNSKHPIIVAIHQNKHLKNISTSYIDDTEIDNKTSRDMLNLLSPSNDGICILGFDDNYRNNRGYFLIKNNFLKWGNGDGFCWIPYTFILPLIEEAYYIKGIV